ncbi:hypothetical protein HPB48_010491 [Haemaphysalis longicornis]|uniref:Uncharacterized protein n=1 Tax=Haemaphysalis longicornis TaxID=44386 RepID=A0A9J6GAB1_HAELO|nr:hypothetical protein HPB48_010491 [Haemaphysalis longicornis]
MIRAHLVLQDFGEVKHMGYGLLHWMAKLSQLRQVSVKHIKKLADIDAERDLKLAPHLKPAYLDQDHFAKMNVASAVAVLNHSVGAAIRVREALTTAWFVERVYRWFTLMTSRQTLMMRQLAFLKEFMEIFAHVSIKKSNQRDQFKPVQAGTHVPRALEFKLMLRLIMLSQFFKPSRKGSYDIDDSVDLLEFVEMKKGSSEEQCGGSTS